MAARWKAAGRLSHVHMLLPHAALAMPACSLRHPPAPRRQTCSRPQAAQQVGHSAAGGAGPAVARRGGCSGEGGAVLRLHSAAQPGGEVPRRHGRPAEAAQPPGGGAPQAGGMRRRAAPARAGRRQVGRHALLAPAAGWRRHHKEAASAANAGASPAPLSYLAPSCRARCCSQLRRTCTVELMATLEGFVVQHVLASRWEQLAGSGARQRCADQPGWPGPWAKPCHRMSSRQAATKAPPCLACRRRRGRQQQQPASRRGGSCGGSGSSSG